MGIKGDKGTADSVIAVEFILEKLAAVDGVSSKKMFGGHGLFHNSKMFGLIDSKGVAFLKADEDTKKAYLDIGGKQHSRMPYYSIPDQVYNDSETFGNWVNKAIELSK